MCRLDVGLIRVPSILAVLIAAGLLSSACGDDDTGNDVPNVTQPELASAVDYYENIQRVNEAAAEEVRRISAEHDRIDRYEPAASVFSNLADETEKFDPAFETVAGHEAYIFTARLIGETLIAIANGDEGAEERLPSLLDDFEFVCRSFIDVARTIFPEGRDLDCTYAYTLTE
jgi:hypothetical protein